MREDIARLTMRVMVGGMMLFHGIHKIINGISGIKAMLQAHHLPIWLVNGVYVGEVLAPLLLILGWKSRIWAGVIAFNMIIAIFLAKGSSLFSLDVHGGWAIELPMFYLGLSVVIILLGSGRFGIEKE